MLLIGLKVYFISSKGLDSHVVPFLSKEEFGLALIVKSFGACLTFTLSTIPRISIRGNGLRSFYSREISKKTSQEFNSFNPPSFTRLRNKSN